MKNLTFAFAAIAMMTIAVPTIASAQDIGVTIGSDHRDRGIEVRRDDDRGFREGGFREGRGEFRGERYGREFHDGRYRSEARMIVVHPHHHRHHHYY